MTSSNSQRRFHGSLPLESDLDAERAVQTTQLSATTAAPDRRLGVRLPDRGKSLDRVFSDEPSNADLMHAKADMTSAHDEAVLTCVVATRSTKRVGISYRISGSPCAL